jgi:aldose 1-epimerase
MKFQVKAFEENGISGIRLSDLSTGTVADVLPGHGMLLHGFRIPVDGSLFNVIDNYSTAAELQSFIDLSYKSCKLSPFACRIPGGKYEFGGERYEVQKKFYDGSSIHGLLSNRGFKVINSTFDDHRALVTGSYEYANEDPGYPFSYRCEITYTLQHQNSLTVDTTVTNLSSHSIPMADGWHPYFQLGSLVDDCVLQFNSATMLEFDERLVPTGKKISYPDFESPAKIGGRKLDNCFQLTLFESGTCCVIADPSGLTLLIGTDRKYPFLQIYIPDHRKSIALENLSGAPDCFNNKMGLIELEPGSSERFTVNYRITA